jgi:hypothetical protein
MQMKYRASVFYDRQLKHIEGGYHEEFHSDYPIKKGNEIRFKDLCGAFLVSSVTIDTKSDTISLLVSPDLRYI